MTHLQTIRDRVIAAVPEIMDRKFGCEGTLSVFGLIEVRVKYAGLSQSRHDKSSRPDGKMVYWVSDQGTVIANDDTKPRIIGRPIRLADILLTVESTRTDGDDRRLEITASGMFCGEIYNWEHVPYFWKLEHDDLNLQSPETIEFLYNLLK